MHYPSRFNILAIYFGYLDFATESNIRKCSTKIQVSKIKHITVKLRMRVNISLTKQKCMENIRNEEHIPLINSTSQNESNTHTRSLFHRSCSESGNLWKIAAPSIFTRLAMFSITVVTQSFAGHLADLDLAAISLACTVLISITFGFMVPATRLLFLLSLFSTLINQHCLFIVLFLT